MARNKLVGQVRKQRALSWDHRGLDEVGHE